MKISMNWLKDLVCFDETPEALARDLSMLGLPVDAVEPSGEDRVFDIDITANRPDGLSHLGIARDVAARYREPLRPPRAVVEGIPEQPLVPVDIRIDAPDLCARYCGMVIRGLRVGPSPAWLRDRLEAVGQRSINNVVDITNFVLLEMGHPLHAFDHRKLREGRIVVRRARDGETLTTLDGQQRKLTPNMLVIADAALPVALAGVMGGADSEVDAQTRDILLESAWFEPSSVRRTARALGLGTEASYRFERGADPEVPPRALLRAAWLVLRLAGGEPASPLLDAHPRPAIPRAIPLRRRRMVSLIGAPVEDGFVEDLLPRLGFRVDRDGAGWSVVAPSHRPDVTQEVDVIEEVARFYGYDRVRSALPGMEGNPVERRFARDRDTLRKLLVAGGYQEITSSSFVDPHKDGVFDFFRAGEAIFLDNPGDEAEPALRTNLTYRLLNALKFNENNFNRDVRLFETADVYAMATDGPRESLRLAVGAFGHALPPHWTMPPGAPYGFFHLKGMVETLLEGLNAVDARIVPLEESPGDFLQAGSRAALQVRGKTVGFLGRLDERVAAAWKFRQSVFVGEFLLEPLFESVDRPFAFTPVPRFPPVSRDISFTVDNAVPFSKIKAVAESVKAGELTRMDAVEIYRGKEIPAGRYAMTVRVVFQRCDGTLTDAEADALRNRLTEALKRSAGIEVR
ncbi:MAG: phenylalanine--tRNA ligase subunit beta [Acidobacteria bacterium]|nr:phenylalanine--tRNA ligase subunit beta [Acidobacteriota bacterium]